MYLDERFLGAVNCYAVKGGPGGRNLLIDTGGDTENVREVYETLHLGKGYLPDGSRCDIAGILAELDMRPENTDVLLTHLHPDHAGNAAVLEKMGYRIMASKTACEKESVKRQIAEDRLRSEGLPKNLGQILLFAELMNRSSADFEMDALDEGNILTYGNYSFQCILTPGHTSGHMSLYDSATKTILLGDAVLFDRVPRIWCASDIDDPIACYFDSLAKLKKRDIELALPSHGSILNEGIFERIQWLIEHHTEKLMLIEQITTESPGLNGYQLIDELNRCLYCVGLEEALPIQQCSTLLEGFAYLDHLVYTDRIMKKTIQGVRHYFPC